MGLIAMGSLFGFQPAKWFQGANPAQISTALLLLPLFLHASTVISNTELNPYDATRYVVLVSLAFTSLYLAFQIPRVVVSPLQLLGLVTAVTLITLSLITNYSNSIRLEAVILLGFILFGLQYHHALCTFGTQGVTTIIASSMVAATLLYTTHAVAMILPHCLFDKECLFLGTGSMGFENRRMYNDVQVLIIPALLWLMIEAKRRRVAAFLGLLAALQLTHLFITYGRAAMLGIALGLGIIWMSQKWTARHYWRLLSTISGAVGLFALLVFLDDAPSTYSTSLRTSDSGRLELWLAAVQGGLNAPLLGQGPGSFASAGFKVATAHNVFLGALHDYGLVFAFLCIAFVIYALFRLDPASKPLLTLFSFSMLSTWLLTNGSYPLTTVFSLIILSLLTATKRSVERPAYAVPSFSFVAAMAAVVVMAILDPPSVHEGPLRPRIWLETPR